VGREVRPVVSEPAEKDDLPGSVPRGRTGDVLGRLPVDLLELRGTERVDEVDDDVDPGEDVVGRRIGRVGDREARLRRVGARPPRQRGHVVRPGEDRHELRADDARRAEHRDLHDAFPAVRCRKRLLTER
jgi:hypothetical protein